MALQAGTRRGRSPALIPRRGRGQYWVVIDGSLEYDGEALAKMSCAFVYPGDPAFRSVAGADGAEVVAMQFPRRETAH